MRIFIATDVRVYQKDGRLYAGPIAAILKRYRENFGAITLCARRIHTDNVEKYTDITDCVDHLMAMDSLLPAVLGTCKKELRQHIADSDLVIGRLHGFTGSLAADCAKQLGKPFFAEMMGDAWDAYWNHSLYGKAIAPFMFLRTRQIVKNADYALYVTNEHLQNRYPCKNESVGVSNVALGKLDPAALENRLEKISKKDPATLTLMTVAAVNVKYKGQEYVIRGIPGLNRAGIRVRYILVGGGSQDYLKSVARKCGVEDQVEFAGFRSRAEVFALLDEADVYIQPSLQEGLPRSAVEAMSRGCPVIGARTGGIPELIAPECVVRRKNVGDIVKTLLVINTPEKLAWLARQNYATAAEYEEEILSARRDGYYRKVKEEVGSH